MSADEASLQRRWARADVPARMTATDGDELRLLYAGTWNHGPGPDFRAACLLSKRDGVLRGDVELHRRPLDWALHGHARDPAYARVVLHVLGRAEPEAEALGRVLELPAEGGAGAALPCEDIVQRAGARAVAALLERLGALRLRRKLERLRGAGAGGAESETAAFAALLRALGQGGNQTAMERLARELPPQRWPASAPGGSGLERALLAAAERLEREGALTWRRAGLRPANRHEARIRAAAGIVERLAPRAGGLAAGLAALAGLPRAEAVERLRVPRVLGPSRALQVLVDCCYPLALARTDDAAAQLALARRWLELPGARYRRSDALRDRLSAQGLARPRNGGSQALLALSQDYCRPGACTLCPLARLAPRPPRRGPLPSTNLPSTNLPPAGLSGRG